MKRYMAVVPILSLVLIVSGCPNPQAAKHSQEVAQINQYKQRGDKLMVMYPAVVEANKIPARDEAGQAVELPHMFAVSQVIEATEKEVLIEQEGGTNKGKRFWVEKRFLLRQSALGGPLDPVYREGLKESATEYQIQR